MSRRRPCHTGDEGSAIPLDVPGMDTSFDYFVDTTMEGGKFVPWRNIVPSFKYDKAVAYTALTRREK
jgi:hypothetical protein